MNPLSSKASSVLLTARLLSVGVFFCLVSPAVSQPLESTGESEVSKIEIDSDTEAFSDRTLQDGPIQVTVSYAPARPGNLTTENLQYEVAYLTEQGLNTANLLEAVDAYYFANVSLTDLDSDGVAEVVVQNYSGGAHCCTNTTVHTWQGDQFKTLETGYSDGLGGEFQDLDGDGLSEFVSFDNRFLYRFSSYAGSFPPPFVRTFDKGEFIDSTRQYPEIIRERIARAEAIFTDGSFTGERNGLLAGYVAMKSLVGEYDEG